MNPSNIYIGRILPGRANRTLEETDKAVAEAIYNLRNYVSKEELTDPFKRLIAKRLNDLSVIVEKVYKFDDCGWRSWVTPTYAIRKCISLMMNSLDRALQQDIKDYSRDPEKKQILKSIQDNFYSLRLCETHLSSGEKRDSARNFALCVAAEIIAKDFSAP